MAKEMKRIDIAQRGKRWVGERKGKKRVYVEGCRAWIIEKGSCPCQKLKCQGWTPEIEAEYWESLEEADE